MASDGADATIVMLGFYAVARGQRVAIGGPRSPIFIGVAAPSI